MAEDLVVSTYARISPSPGIFERIVIHHGAVVTSDYPIELIARKSIIVLGRILAPPGVSVTLRTTQGNILVFLTGSIRTSDRVTPMTEGASGEAAGDIKLISDNGWIQQMGQLRTGDGGNGEDKEELVNRQNVIGGSGGDGGDILLKATRIYIGGRLSSGNGGYSGQAKALSFDSDEIIEQAEQDNQIEPVDERFLGVPNTFTATSGKGGNGGSIACLCDELNIYRSSKIATGNGGASQSAEAFGAEYTISITDTPGNGGEFSVNKLSAPSLTMQLSDNSISTGDGGMALEAFAAATKTAEAIVNAGGSPGRAVALDVADLPYQKGSGGNSKKALAQTPSQNVEKSERRSQGSRPGEGATAQAVEP